MPALEMKVFAPAGTKPSPSCRGVVREGLPGHTQRADGEARRAARCPRIPAVVAAIGNEQPQEAGAGEPRHHLFGREGVPRRFGGGAAEACAQGALLLGEERGRFFSLPCVVRRAEIRVHHADGLGLGLRLQGRLEGHGVLALQHLLRHAVGEGGPRREALGEGRGLGQCGPLRYDPVHEADAKCILGAHEIAGEEDLRGAAEAHHPRQQVRRAHVGPAQAHPRKHEAEARPGLGDAHVAREGDDGPRPHGHALHGGHHGLAQPAQAADEGAGGAGEGEETLGVPGEELGDDVVLVAAGAEGAPLASEDHGPHLVVALQAVEVTPQLLVDGEGEAVQALGAREGEGRDAAREGGAKPRGGGEAHRPASPGAASVASAAAPVASYGRSASASISTIAPGSRRPATFTRLMAG